MVEKRTVLITGGAGAIGSLMAKKYLDEGYRVLVVDNLMKTRDTQNIDALLKHPNFKFIKHDIIEPLNLPGE